MSELANRSTLKVAVAAVCKQSGFDITDELTLETLTEMLQSHITEAGRSSKLMAEFAGRTEVTPTDVSLALIEMGFDINSLMPYLERRENSRIIVPSPRASAQPNDPKMLRVGTIRPHLAHIPEHMPPFPDPHTYIHTNTQIEFSADYESARISCANQQRNIELGLVRFMRDVDAEATLKLIVKDKEFKVIAPTPEPKSYLSALLPPEDERLEYGREDEDNSTLKNCDNPFLRPVKMPRSVEKL